MNLKEYEQPTKEPVPKVMAVGEAGAVVTVILLVLKLLGIEVPPELVGEAVVGTSAIVSLVVFLAGYWKKDAKPVTVVKEIKEVAKEEQK